MQEVDTIIVGAGITGLSAADRLVRAGQRVIVLEKTGRPGGRMVRITHNGDMAEAGMQGYFENYTEARRLLRQYGLEGEWIEKATGSTIYLDRDGNRRTVRGNWSLLNLLGLKGAWDAFRFERKFRNGGQKFSPFEISKSIPEYDNVTAADATSWCGTRFRDYVLRPMTHAMTTSDPRGTNLYYLVNVLRQTQYKNYYLRGGNAKLPETMAQRLPVRYHASVSKITSIAGKITGVELEGGEAIAANHVILACPAGVAGHLLPEAHASARSFLQRFPHTPYALPFFFLREGLGNGAYFYAGHPNRDAHFNAAIDHSIYTPEHVPSGRAVLSGWAAYPQALELATWSDERVIDQAILDLEPLLPGFSGKIDHVEVVRHDWGVARYEPGMHQKIIDFKEQVSGWEGISFAGTDYDCPHIEGGIGSGYRAADRALRNGDDVKADVQPGRKGQ